MTAKLMEDRLRLAREYRLAKAEAVALTDLAELKLLQGDLPEAERTIEESLSRHGQTVYARTQRIFGRILLARRRCAEAIEALEKGLAAARASRAIEEQALIGFELAQALAEDGDLAKAREQLEAAEATTPLDPALNLMARALYTRGVIHARAQETNEANRCMGQSLSIFQTIGDPYRAALCHEAIGGIADGSIPPRVGPRPPGRSPQRVRQARLDDRIESRRGASGGRVPSPACRRP